METTKSELGSGVYVHANTNGHTEKTMKKSEPLLTRDVQRDETGSPWIRTAERPPTENDAAYVSRMVLTVPIGALNASMAVWFKVADNPSLYPLWMPSPP